jgi:hypothetical protein
VHPVHVSHFNALSDRFPAYTPPDEGLHPYDRLDVTLEHLLHFLSAKETIELRLLQQIKVGECLPRLRKLYGCRSDWNYQARTALP